LPSCVEMLMMCVSSYSPPHTPHTPHTLLSPSLAAESSPTKKPRLDGAKPKSKKEKHKHKHKNKDHHHHHHHKHSGSEPKPVKPVGGSRPNGKVSSSVKKEPVTPVKRKPMISESDDDDDMIPPAVSRVQAPKEAPAVVAVAQMTPPTFRRPHPLPVKEEVDRSTADPKPKVLPMVKRESSADENGGPIAKKKSQPAPTVKVSI
jgi:hypothetical protein